MNLSFLKVLEMEIFSVLLRVEIFNGIYNFKHLIKWHM
jgi:hypothetical protein